MHSLSQRSSSLLDTKDVGQARSIPPWLPLHWHADQGELLSSGFNAAYTIAVKASSDKIIREMEMFGPEFKTLFLET